MLNLCVSHQQEPNRSHFDHTNCDYCKLLVAVNLNPQDKDVIKDIFEMATLALEHPTIFKANIALTSIQILSQQLLERINK